MGFTNFILITAFAFISVGCSQREYFVLLNPLEFTKGSVVGPVTRSQLVGLMDAKVKIGTDEEDGYEFLVRDPKTYQLHRPEAGRIRTETCREYFVAVSQGAEPMTTFDYTMNGWFYEVCSVLKFTEGAIRPKHSLLPSPTFHNLSIFPAFLLPPEEESEKGRAEQMNGLSIQDYLDRKKIQKTGSSAHTVTFETGGVEMTWRAMCRADFNRDGYEDVLVMPHGRFIGGTGRWCNPMILTKTPATGKFVESLPLDLDKFTVGSPTNL